MEASKSHHVHSSKLPSLQPIAVIIHIFIQFCPLSAIRSHSSLLAVMDMDVSQPTSAEPNELERLIFAEENALKHLIRSNEQLQVRH